MRQGTPKTKLTNFKSVIEVPDFAQVVQKLVDPGFIVFNKRIKSHHVRLFRIRGLVSKILEHFRDLCRA